MEITRLVIVTRHFPYNVRNFHLYLSIRVLFEQVWRKVFWKLLGDTVTKVCASPKKLTWFTRLVLLMKGRVWGRDYHFTSCIAPWSGEAECMAEPDRTCRNDYPRYVALDMCVQSLYMCLEYVGCCRYDWSYKFAQEYCSQEFNIRVETIISLPV